MVQERSQSEPLMVEGDGPAQQQSIWERFSIVIVFVIFVTFRAADRVFLKALNNALQRPAYNLIWGNLMWPIAIQIMTVGMIGVYVMIMRWQGDKRYNLKFFAPGSSMASTMGPVPLWQLALFSLGDQLNAALSSPASPFVSQPIQSVMTNAILIWMAIISYFWIGARYKQVHYVGMVLVMVACVVQLSTPLSDNNCSEPLSKACFAAYHSPLHGGEYIKLSASAMAFWYGLFLVSTFPGAVGNVYKQRVLQAQDVDVFYATWWSGNFQVLWGLICLPLMFMPLPGQETPKISEFFSEIGHTFACMGGSTERAGDGTCGTSPPPYFWIIVYLLFNITFNLAMTWLVKKISAAWAQIATVVCLGMCNIFSTSKLIMGASAEPMSLDDWLGVVIVCISLWVYNLESEVSNYGKVTQAAAPSFVSDGHANLAEKIDGRTDKGSFVKQG